MRTNVDPDAWEALGVTHCSIEIVAALTCFLMLASQGFASDGRWKLTRGIELVSRWPKAPTGMGEDRATAVRYRPYDG